MIVGDKDSVSLLRIRMVLLLLKKNFLYKILVITLTIRLLNEINDNQ